MQMTTLPIPLAIASPSPSTAPAPAPQRANAAASAEARQFSQSLSREMEQRRHDAAPPARPQGAGATKELAGAPAKAGDEVEDDTDAADAHDAHAAAAAINPVTDMLALVASFNRLLAPPTPTPAAPATDPLAAAAATQVTAQASALLAAAGTAPGLPVTASASEGAARFGLPLPGGDAAAHAKPKDAAAMAATAPDPSMLETATRAPAGADGLAAPARAREIVADVAALKEPAAAVPVAAPLQQAALAMVQALAASGVPADKNAARVGTPGWDNQVGQKIIWMVAGKEQTASLTLNPPDMGPMQVVLSVTNDHATVTFTAAQPEVRQALEAAMPKLREMLGDSGIALDQASVNAGTPDGRQAQQGEPRGQAGNTRVANGGAAAEPISLAPTRQGRSGGGSGMVDTFA